MPRMRTAEHISDWDGGSGDRNGDSVADDGSGADTPATVDGSRGNVVIETDGK